ncbi:Lipopolysaccharide-induced tumor necrosis factor-alpha factor [Operophtera brumata]|uniref:Lipopolysaccharide-induced tumor necrosis factor-alpha factor n=1 Tax=Operophtera brumata TaxID=104452 RepID=A0A0L7L8Y5_OPEBR|nr:Lipopolysaccharide-induced tumor necrosis factor-alpha factor [Operophtera brumata]
MDSERYPAPGHQAHYGPTPGAQTAVVMTPAVIVTQQMGPRPTHVTCKSCHADVVTRVEANATTRTHLFALILCLIGCWPCVCVPYCVDDCMNANHYCPNCNSYIGIGPDPTQIICPSCQSPIMTRVERKATTRTHVIAVLLCVFLNFPVHQNGIVNVKMNIVAVGPEPTQVTCPSCRATVLTKIEHKATTRTHCSSLTRYVNVAIRQLL